MSIWISDSSQIRPLVGALCLTALASCGGIGMGRFAPAKSAVQSQRTTIEVSSKNLVIQGPQGFCVDSEVTEVEGDNAFVLLGDCAIVSPKTRSPEPKVRAILTASVSGAGQGIARIADAAPGMDTFFRSENGRTALSRASDPGTVQVLDTFRKDETFFLRASDTSDGLLPGASEDYWRAYFDLEDQIVSVSVIGFKDTPLTPDVSLDTLREFTRNLKLNNGVDPGPEIVEDDDQDETYADSEVSNPPQHVDPVRTLRTIGLLRRIFF